VSLCERETSSDNRLLRRRDTAASPLAYYGAPRYTGDMDLFVRRTEVNAQHIIAALKEFGFAFPNLTWNDFVKDDTVIQLGPLTVSRRGQVLTRAEPSTQQE